MEATLESPAERATTLLRRHLTPDQRASYDRAGMIDVLGQDGRIYRLYQLTNQDMIRVTLIRTKDAAPGRLRYCTAPESPNLPAADQMLAYLLLLNGDIDMFHRHANPFPMDSCDVARWTDLAEWAAERRHRYAQGNHTALPLRPQPRRRTAPAWLALWPIAALILGIAVMLVGIAFQQPLIVVGGFLAGVGGWLSMLWQVARSGWR